MVKLTVAPPELYAKEKKLPPGCALVEIPLEKEDVEVAQRPFWTKGTVCSLLTFLTILAVGGALLALYSSQVHHVPRCYDWGPDCEMKGPPVPPEEYFHDGPGIEPQSGGNSHEMHGSHGRNQGSQHGGHHPDGHNPDGARHGGHSSSSSSSEEQGSGHGRHHDGAGVIQKEDPMRLPRLQNQ